MAQDRFYWQTTYVNQIECRPLPYVHKITGHGWVPVLYEAQIELDLTECTERNPSWEATSISAGQEIPRLWWNPKFHYRVHKCHWTLSCASRIQFLTPIISNMYFNILASMPRSSKWYLPFSNFFPYQPRGYRSTGILRNRWMEMWGRNRPSLIRRRRRRSMRATCPIHLILFEFFLFWHRG
jgi:hypothetical protein